MIKSLTAKKLGPKNYVVSIVVGDIRFDTKAESWEICMRIVDLIIREAEIDKTPIPEISF